MTEAQHQAMVMKWSQQPEIRSRWPELALLYHIPNGGTRDAIEGRHLKQQGVKRGVPDLCLPVARENYHALYIELKPIPVEPQRSRMVGRTSQMPREYVAGLSRLGGGSDYAGMVSLPF